MPAHDVLLLGYGLAATGTGINSVAWFRLLFDRWRIEDRPYWFFDLFCVVRVGMSVVSASLLVPYLTRIIEMLSGVPVSIPSWIYVASMFGLAIGEAAFIRATWIAGQRLPSGLWLSGCIGWTGFCLLRLGV